MSSELNHPGFLCCGWLRVVVTERVTMHAIWWATSTPLAYVFCMRFFFLVKSEEELGISCQCEEKW